VATGVDLASNRNEYQEYFLGGKGGQCIGLTTLPPSCANCLEIWEPQTLGTLKNETQSVQQRADIILKSLDSAAQGVSISGL
jgi:hypothetical protein